MQIFSVFEDNLDCSKVMIEDNVSAKKFGHPVAFSIRRSSPFAELTDGTLSHTPSHEEEQLMELIFHIYYYSLEPAQ